MQLSLDSQIQQLITDRIKSGRYASAEEVVTAALVALEHEERSPNFTPGELNRLVAEAEASGPPLDGETVFAELRAKHRARARQA